MAAIQSGRPMAAAVGLAARQLTRGAVVWSSVFALTAFTTVRGYTAAYRTAAERRSIAVLLGRNPAFDALYGVARRIDTPGGFTAWRVGGFLLVLSALWALLAATRLIRGEEEAGRTELVRAGAVTSLQATAAVLVALALGVVVVSVSLFATLWAAGLAPAGSGLLACNVALVGFAFAALGTLTAQLASARRRAAAQAGAVLGAAFAVRLVADGTRGLGWLRWCSPLGWAEETRPFAGNRLGPLVLLIGWTLVFGGVGVWLQARRDLGAGVLGAGRAPRSRLRLLGSSLAFALRSEIGVVAAWTVGIGTGALLFGVLAKDVGAFISTSNGVQRTLARLVAGSIVRPAGFLGFTFTFLVLPVTVMGVLLVGAARAEESAGRLEPVLACAVPRWRWLVGRVAVIVGAVVVTLVACTVLTWLGAATRHAGVGLGDMARAGVNCLPPALLFMGIAVAAFGVLPRATVAVGAGAVVLAYLVQIVGAAVRFPAWVLDVSPFHHMAAVPATPANVTASVVMLCVAAAFVASGLIAFSRRDLAPA